MPAKIRMCACVHAQSYVCARVHERRDLFLLPYFAACISPALSGHPFTPFSSPLAPPLVAHFFLVSADEDRSLATRREEWKMRGVEGEKKRW